jgi:hypothetical protein
MTLEEMNHKMLYQLLGNQLVLMEECKRGAERGVAYTDRMIEGRRRDSINLLIAVSNTDKEQSCRHKWGTDGAHSNEFCKKCFASKPLDEQTSDEESSCH